MRLARNRTLTPQAQTHLVGWLPALAAVMEMAAGGSLTSYVADKWQKAQALGLFLSEDEARYFFKVRPPPLEAPAASGCRPPVPSPCLACLASAAGQLPAPAGRMQGGWVRQPFAARWRSRRAARAALQTSRAAPGGARTTLSSLSPPTHNTRSLPPVQQFLSAVKYCHGHFVAHRDLKLDNTLLDG